MLERVRLKNFTAFDELVFNPGSGLNVIIGENGVGKTHLMQVMYAACEVTKTQDPFPSKLISTFMPQQDHIGRLVRHGAGRNSAEIETHRRDLSDTECLQLKFTRRLKSAHRNVRNREPWQRTQIESAFITTKDVLANARGFAALYERRVINFSSIDRDILIKAALPRLRELTSQTMSGLVKGLIGAIGGEVVMRNTDEFFFCTSKGDLEFHLVNGGSRKFGLLQLLIQNGVIAPGSVLFWDMPETGLDYYFLRVVAHIVLQLQRMRIQVFLTTHSHALLEEIEIQRKASDLVSYTNLYYSEDDMVRVEHSKRASDLPNNGIVEAVKVLEDRKLKRGLNDE